MPDRDAERGQGERDQGERETFRERIRREVRRRERAREREDRSAWLGLSYFGMVGWPIVLLTLLGLIAGLWLDNNLSAPFPWTVAGVVLGATLGVLLAGYWVHEEQKAMERNGPGTPSDHADPLDRPDLERRRRPEARREEDLHDRP